MELKDVLKKIEEAKVVVNQDPNFHPKTHAGKLGQIRRAKEDLKMLYSEYREAVRSKIVFIIPTGLGASKFSDIADKEYGCFKSDAEGVYNEVTENINSALYENTTFNPSSLETSMNYFRELADEIGLLSYPQVIFKSNYAKPLKNKEDFRNSLKEAINEQIGSDIVGHYTVDRISTLAVNDKFAGKIVPVVMSSSDLELLNNLSQSLKSITSRVFVVDTKEEVSEKEVEKVLLKIKKTVV